MYTIINEQCLIIIFIILFKFINGQVHDYPRSVFFPNNTEFPHDFKYYVLRHHIIFKPEH